MAARRAPMEIPAHTPAERPGVGLLLGLLGLLLGLGLGLELVSDAGVDETLLVLLIALALVVAAGGEIGTPNAHMLWSGAYVARHVNVPVVVKRALEVARPYSTLYPEAMTVPSVDCADLPNEVTVTVRAVS